MVHEALQETSIVTSPLEPSPQAVSDPVTKLPYEELMQLALERLNVLPFEEVVRLFGDGLKGLPFGDIQQLAGERLEDLPVKEIRRLARERLQENKVGRCRSCMCISTNDCPGPRQGTKDHQIGGSGGVPFGVAHQDASQDETRGRASVEVGGSLQAQAHRRPKDHNRPYRGRLTQDTCTVPGLQVGRFEDHQTVRMG